MISILVFGGPLLGDPDRQGLLEPIPGGRSPTIPQCLGGVPRHGGRSDARTLPRCALRAGAHALVETNIAGRLAGALPAIAEAHDAPKGLAPARWHPVTVSGTMRSMSQVGPRVCFLSVLLVIASACAPSPVASHSPAPASANPSAASQPAQASPICGPWSAAGSATADEVSRRYGEIRNCLLAGNDWVLTTLGLVGAHGVVGLDDCGVSDTSCRDGSVDHPFASWHFYSAPFPGGVTVLGQSQGGLVVDNGGHQIRFTLATASFES